MTLLMSDAAFFTPAMLTGFDAVNVYIGGRNAAHIWSDDDIKAAGRIPKLPNYVPSPDETVPDARQEVIALLDRFLHLNIRAPQLIAFDLETSTADLAYITAMGDYLRFFGYGTIGYGSLSTIESQVPPYLWKWAAEWDGNPVIQPGMMAKQYNRGSAFDASVISQQVYDLLVWR